MDFIFTFASFNSVKCICLLCTPETVNNLHVGSEEPFDYFMCFVSAVGHVTG